MSLFASGQVGRPPGTLTVQIPYADPAALNGSNFGMVDTTKFWNYGRNDGLSPVPAQPMAFLPGPAPPVLLGGFAGPQIQLLGGNGLYGPSPIQLLGAAGDPTWSVTHPKTTLAIITGVMAGAAAVGGAVAGGRGQRGRYAAGGALMGAGLGLALSIIYGLS